MFIEVPDRGGAMDTGFTFLICKLTKNNFKLIQKEQIFTAPAVSLTLT